MPRYGIVAYDDRMRAVGRPPDRLARFERVTELPLLVLALAMVPLLFVPLVVELPQTTRTAITVVDWAIWAVFAAELGVRLVLTDRRAAFLRRNWPDLAIVILPFLRPLRIARSARALRLLRLGRVMAVLARAGRSPGSAMLRKRINGVVLAAASLAIGMAFLVLAVESGGAGSIDTLGDALWWALTTVTTVGYGDAFPVTAPGRLLAAVLMIGGVALFGVLTANIAAYFVETDGGQGEEFADVGARLDRIEAQLLQAIAAARAGTCEGDGEPPAAVRPLGETDNRQTDGPAPA